jgi:hypothetical protein
VSADEAERLGLIPGQQVWVEAAGAPAARLLLAGTEANPPFVWMTFHPLAGRHVA